MTAVIETVVTPDGPFTLLTDDVGAVLASGWTDDDDAILARLHPANRPATLTRGDGSTGAAHAVAAYYDGDLAAIAAVPVHQSGTEAPADRLAHAPHHRAGRAPHLHRARGQHRPTDRRPGRSLDLRPQRARALRPLPPRAADRRSARWFRLGARGQAQPAGARAPQRFLSASATAATRRWRVSGCLASATARACSLR